MARYTVAYKLWAHDPERYIEIYAPNKEAAYLEAVYEKIPAENDGEQAYSAWVDKVAYKSGRVHSFNTFEGDPY